MNVHCDALQTAAAIAHLEENPTEVVVDEVESAGEELVDAGLATDIVSRQAVEVAQVTESLESFVNGVFANVGPGEWNAKVARQYQLGVGNILGSVGVNLNPAVYSASFEDAGTTQTNEENREESETKGKGIVGRMWDSFLKALETLINAMLSWVGKVGNNAAAIQKAGKDLQARAATTKGNPSKDKFEGQPAWASYLFKNGAMGKPTAAVASAGYEMEHVAIPSIMAYADAAKVYVAAAAEGNEVEIKQLKSELDEIAKEAGDVFGNQKLEMKVEETGLIPVLSVSVVKGEAAKGDISVLTISEVNDLANAIIKSGESMTKVETAMKKAVESTKSLKAKLSSATKGGSNIKASDLTKTVSNITTIAKAILPYAAGLAQKAFAHGNASLKLYKEGGAEVDSKKEAPSDKKAERTEDNKDEKKEGAEEK